MKKTLRAILPVGLLAFSASMATLGCSNETGSIESEEQKRDSQVSADARMPDAGRIDASSPDASSRDAMLSDASQTSCRITPEFAAQARALMVAEGLVREGDEGDFGSVRLRWIPAKTVPLQGDACAVVMITDDESTLLQPRTTLGNTLDVVVYQNGRFQTVERYLGLDLQSARFDGIAQGIYGYYFELQGLSAINARKLLLANIRLNAGAWFQAWVARGQKPSFDPTPNRNWFVAKAELDLRNGVATEVLDVQATDWDHDFQGFYDGTLSGNLPNLESRIVGPWHFSLAERLASGGDWPGGADAFQCEQMLRADLEYTEGAPLSPADRETCRNESHFPDFRDGILTRIGPYGAANGRWSAECGVEFCEAHGLPLGTARNGRYGGGS